MSKRICIVFCFTILGGIVFAPLFDNQQVFAQRGILESVKKQCENKYDSYKKLGKESFVEKNPHLAYLSNCFVLYEDPTWKFNGKEKIDRFYDKYYQVKSQENSLIKNHDNHRLDFKNLSLIKIGYQEYALKIRICTGDEFISEPKFFVITDKEYYLAKSTRPIKENSCNFVMSYSHLEDPGKISLVSFDGNYMPSKYLKVKSVY